MVHRAPLDRRPVGRRGRRVVTGFLGTTSYGTGVRVIGGRSRGRRLSGRLPAGVRPTSDRVREAIFDVLGSMGGVNDLGVVDLFCGSGAMGVEALSRGAASATFVDHDPGALEAVRTNLAAVGLEGESATVLRADAARLARALGALRHRLLRPALRLRRLGHRPRLAPGRRRDPGIGRRDRRPGGLGGDEIQAVRRYARDRGPSSPIAERDRVVTRALYPGSFDPFHNGHLEVVERAARIFDEVVIAALRNPQKNQALFDLDARHKMVDESVAHLDNVRFISMSKLVVEVARDIEATVIIRGLRVVSDFENELQMAQMNRELSGIETVFIPTSSSHSFIASRLLREVATFGGDVSKFVPKPVAAIMEEQLGARGDGDGA